ncbi:hypothetical protein Patl1_22858 [Pistacia atlantica]|uniref:Uncharacterized protein n=1 Tax=Pistacia atlantica TaxID=434234 RepID=A0ACC0ZV40_9ROSI|nr:hypothetical protein Patl1_22858 [Pistacia atlantica]
MGEREAGCSSSLAGGGENQLESIVILTNGANPPGPLSENEKMWLESFVNGESFKNQHKVIWPKIERVPAMLREVKDNSGCYDPMVVSIGPYHFGNTRLELMERYKHTMAVQYVDGDLKLLEELYQKVRCVAEAAKQCYTDQRSVAKFNNEEFSQMMFLDACFLLQFINCITLLFNPGYLAKLELPPVCIDDSTKSMLLNMVAYESSPNGPDDFGVSSYICLMDSLIDHAEDVMELRNKGILLNFLGSDQQVADLFNEIADNLVSHQHAYTVVKDKIEKHYKNRLKIWLAEWLHTHFSSPWTLLAFIGAVLVLVLTVIQTYESVKPSIT